MQSVCKQIESAAIAAFAQTAMRFNFGTPRAKRTLYRYGKKVAVPMQRTPRATVRSNAGLAEVAAAAQFAPMRFEHRDHADARYMQTVQLAHGAQVAHERTNPANNVPYAMVAYRLQLRARQAAMR